MIRIFPVAGGAQYTNDWGYPRGGGRTHKGNDLFAAEGTPLLAVDDGEVRFGTDPFGGQVAALYPTGENVRYYYAHLSAYEGDAPRQARAGEVIGYVGHTGTAENTAPHLHFEMHPERNYLNAVNPYPSLQEASIAQAPNGGGGFSIAGRRIAPAVALLAAGAIAAGVWAYMNPTAARRLVRSV